MSKKEHNSKNQRKFWWASHWLLVWTAVSVFVFFVFAERLLIREVSLRDLSRRHSSQVRVHNGLGGTLWWWRTTDLVVERTALSDWLRSEIPEIDDWNNRGDDYVIAYETRYRDGECFDWGARSFIWTLYARSNYHLESTYPGFRSGDEYWTDWSESHVDEARVFWRDVLHLLRHGMPNEAAMFVRMKHHQIQKGEGGSEEFPAGWMLPSMAQE